MTAKIASECRRGLQALRGRDRRIPDWRSEAPEAVKRRCRGAKGEHSERTTGDQFEVRCGDIEVFFADEVEGRALVFQVVIGHVRASRSWPSRRILRG